YDMVGSYWSSDVCSSDLFFQLPFRLVSKLSLPDVEASGEPTCKTWPRASLVAESSTYSNQIRSHPVAKTRAVRPIMGHPLNSAELVVKHSEQSPNTPTRPK